MYFIKTLLFTTAFTFVQSIAVFASTEEVYNRSEIIDIMPTSYKEREIVPFPWQARGTWLKQKAVLPALPPTLKAHGVNPVKWDEYFSQLLPIRKKSLNSFASIYAQLFAGPLTLGLYSYYVGTKELSYSVALMDWLENFSKEVLEPAGLFGKFQMHYGYSEHYGESSSQFQAPRMWISVSLNNQDADLLRKESEYWISDKEGKVLKYQVKPINAASDIQITPAGCFLDCAAAPYFP